MTNPKIKSNIIKYASGKKMQRIGFDIPVKLAETFKKKISEEGRTIVGVLKPKIEEFLNEGF